MQLFAPERPEISPGHKALLIDGSAVPNFVVSPLEDGDVLLSAMLRKYDAMGGYARHEVEIPSQELHLFFSLFRADPEQALEDYFNWRPSAKPTARIIPIRAVAPIASPLEDLL